MFPTAHGVVSQGGNVVPPEPGDGYRYYRLNITSNNGRNTVNVGEVQLRETPGGPNAATGGTATASSTFSGFPASNAFDGDPDTYWSSAVIAAPAATASSIFSGFPASNAFDANPSTFWSTQTNVTEAWLRRDLGATATLAVASYKITARSDSGNGAPKDWTLEYSADDTNWSVAHTVTNETGWGAGETRAFNFTPVGAYQYWRLNITSNNGRNTVNVAELELLGSLHGAVLQYDFGVGKGIEVAEYVIRARADASNGTPRDWVLEASNDLMTWDELDTVTGETGWSNGEQRVFTL